MAALSPGQRVMGCEQPGTTHGLAGHSMELSWAHHWHRLRGLGFNCPGGLTKARQVSLVSGWGTTGRGAGLHPQC